MVLQNWDGTIWQACAPPQVQPLQGQETCQHTPRISSAPPMPGLTAREWSAAGLQADDQGSTPASGRMPHRFSHSSKLREVSCCSPDRDSRPASVMASMPLQIKQAQLGHPCRQPRSHLGAEAYQDALTPVLSPTWTLKHGAARWSPARCCKPVSVTAATLLRSRFSRAP